MRHFVTRFGCQIFALYRSIHLKFSPELALGDVPMCSLTLNNLTALRSCRAYSSGIGSGGKAESVALLAHW